MTPVLNPALIVMPIEVLGLILSGLLRGQFTWLEGCPYDVELGAVNVDPLRRVILIEVWHPSFEAVAAGEPLPKLKLIGHTSR